MAKSTDEILSSLLLPRGSDWRIKEVHSDDSNESIYVEVEYCKADIVMQAGTSPYTIFAQSVSGDTWTCGNTRRSSRHAYPVAS